MLIITIKEIAGITLIAIIKIKTMTTTDKRIMQIELCHKIDQVKVRQKISELRIIKIIQKIIKWINLEKIKVNESKTKENHNNMNCSTNVN